MNPQRTEYTIQEGRYAILAVFLQSMQKSQFIHSGKCPSTFLIHYQFVPLKYIHLICHY